MFVIFNYDLLKSVTDKIDNITIIQSKTVQCSR